MIEAPLVTPAEFILQGPVEHIRTKVLAHPRAAVLRAAERLERERPGGGRDRVLAMLARRIGLLERSATAGCRRRHRR